MKRHSYRLRLGAIAFLAGLALQVSAPVETAQTSSEGADSINQVLEWNQIVSERLFTRRSSMHTTVSNDGSHQFSLTMMLLMVRRGERPSSLLRILRWSFCSLPESRLWMPVMWLR